MSMNFEISGRVKVIGEAQTFGSGFTKREFVVTIDEGDKYPQDIPFDCVQDKVSLLDGVNVGDVVDISYNMRGREYNGRYFLNLQAWKLSVSEAGGHATEAPPVPPPPPVDDGADIPF